MSGLCLVVCLMLEARRLHFLDVCHAVIVTVFLVDGVGP